VVTREPAVGRPVAFAAVTIVVARPGVELALRAEGPSTEVRITVRVRVRVRVRASS